MEYLGKFDSDISDEELWGNEEGWKFLSREKWEEPIPCGSADFCTRMEKLLDKPLKKKNKHRKRNGYYGVIPVFKPLKQKSFRLFGKLFIFSLYNI